MRLRPLAFPASFFLLPCLFAGCAILSVAAYKLKPPETINPKYNNLVNQSVGVMVWADRGVRIDWPTLQLDVASSVQRKLKDQTLDAKGKPKAKTLLGVTYPTQPASIARYQSDHPEVEAMPVTDVASKLGVSRLIYVEMEDFATRAGQAIDLFRGQAKATVRIVEITPDGQASVAYTWENVQAIFPPKSPPEGIANVGDQRIYAGIVDAFATEIAQLFYPYEVEEP
jgi:hypothetical protein